MNKKQISRRQFLRTAAKIFAGTLAVAVGGGYAGYHYTASIEPGWLDITRVQVPLKNIGPALDGFKIVHMSDLHLKPFTDIEMIQAAVATANSLNPDLVALTGDFVLQEAEAIFDLAPVLTTLNATYGIYTVFGNHDLWTNREVVRLGMTESGIPMLKNEGRALSVGNETLYLAGVDDVWSGQPDLRAALATAPADTPTILLSHEPDPVDTFSREGQISLQLSGHTHGGQVRLPGIGPLVLPPHGIKYDQGLFQVNDTWLYTNRGLGVIFPPVRLNCRPELTEITLTRA